MITIGRPTHLKLKDRNISACGMVGSVLAAYDPRDVNCLRCRKTKRYREAMEGKKP